MLIPKSSPTIKNHIKWLSENDSARSQSNYWYIDPEDERFEAWFILKKNQDIVACSAIQRFFNCGRVLTRFSITPSYRTKGMQLKPIQNKTFAFAILKEQLDYCKRRNFDHAFFSTEDNRKGVIKRHIRMANELGIQCELLDGKFNTCRPIHGSEINNDPSCWQNIGLYRLTNKEFPLEKLQNN